MFKAIHSGKTIVDEAGRAVACCVDPDKGHLMAAAPDLLAACLACVRQWEEWAAFDGCADEIPAEIALARAAIAKARGSAS